jgi:hypothetical protein
LNSERTKYKRKREREREKKGIIIIIIITIYPVTIFDRVVLRLERAEHVKK